MQSPTILVRYLYNNYKVKLSGIKHNLNAFLLLM